MSSLPSSDSPLSENLAPALPAAPLNSADSFDSQMAKAGIKRFAALWPLIPPVALFGIAFAFMGAPLPKPLGNNASAASRSIISASQWVVPASETIVVSRQAASGYALMSGRLRISQGEAVMAASRGEVARVMARVGQVVRPGEPLLLISRGAIDGPVSTSPLEKWQTKAEDAQIAAAKQQEALESRIGDANERMKTAQDRVAAAQARVADARILIKRLQDGEEVGRSEIVNRDSSKSAVSTSSRQPGNSSQGEKARTDAARESQRLQKAADAAEARAKAAAREAKTADGAMGEKQSDLKAAVAALAAAKSAPKSAPVKTPAAGETGTDATTAPPQPAAPDTGKETRAVERARDALAAATSRAAEAHREASKLKERAAEMRSDANDAARRAMQSLQVFDGESAATPPAKIARDTTPRETSHGGDEKITIADAAGIARQAMKESDEAIADADRIRREVKSYERPVSGAKRLMDDTTRRLQSAQEKIWNTTGSSHPSITQIGASAGGTVLSIANMASEVNLGQAVATIGRPDRLDVTIQDTTDLWKSIVPGTRVFALVKTDAQNPGNASATLAPAVGSSNQSAPDLARPASATPAGATPAMSGTPTLARVLSILPPARAGAPAMIRVAIHNPPQSGSANLNGAGPRAFAPGMGVIVSLAKPGKHVMIRVPTVSIRRDTSGKTTVAVLSPLPDASGDQLASACHVDWREVQVGAGDGAFNQIINGLLPGERVALQPQQLYEFTQAHGAQATIRVEQI